MLWGNDLWEALWGEQCVHGKTQRVCSQRYAFEVYWSIAYCLLPIAYCPLPIAYCLLPIAYCLLPIAMPIAYCLLPIAYCLAYSLLPIASCIAQRWDASWTGTRRNQLSRLLLALCVGGGTADFPYSPKRVFGYMNCNALLQTSLEMRGSTRKTAACTSSQAKKSRNRLE